MLHSDSIVADGHPFEERREVPRMPHGATQKMHLGVGKIGGFQLFCKLLKSGDRDRY